MLIIESVPSTDLSALKRMSHLNGSTINALLSAVSLAALSTTLFHSNNDLNTVYLSFTYAVDLRAVMSQPIPLASGGTYVSGVDSEHLFRRDLRLGKEEIWQLARTIKASQASSLAYSYQQIGLLAWVSGPWSALMEKLGQRQPNGRTHSVSVSNLGLTEFRAHYGQYRLTRSSFLHFKGLEGGVITLSVMTALDATSLCFTVPRVCMSQVDAEAYVRQFMITLREAIHSE